MDFFAENVGTVVKLNIGVCPMGDVHMEDMDFVCEFYAQPTKRVTVNKSEMIRLDADNYIAVFDTGKIGAGEILCRLACDIPDVDVSGGYRKEIVTFSTGVNMVK